MNDQALQREREVRKLAAEWAVRLDDSPLSKEEARSLRAWLALDPCHAEALQLARQTWGDLAGSGSAARLQSRLSPSSQPVSVWQSRRRRSLRMLRGATLLALCGSLTWAYWPALYLPFIADYRTAAGEVRTLALPDGSQVTLDAQSAIRLDYTAQSRRIELLAGSAIFQTAPLGDQEARPFVVAADAVQAQALGTRFLVIRGEHQHTLVGVLQHSVAVSANNQQMTLAQSQSAGYYAESGLVRLDLDLQRMTSWQRGMLIFQQVPLGQVVDQLNRYRSRHILIRNQQLAQRKISAVFRLDSLDNAVAAISSEIQARNVNIAGISLIY